MCTRHFQRMAEGKLKPNHKRQYVVEKIQMGGTMKEPAINFAINFVTHVAQAVELAESELKKVNRSLQSKERSNNPKRIPRGQSVLTQINYRNGRHTR